MAPLRPSPRAGRRNGTSKPRVRPVRPPQYRGRTSQNVGATLVSPGIPTQRRNWPETPRTPPRTTPRTGCAVPAPGVINGAPTSITARRPPQRRRIPPPNVGATLVSPGKPTQRHNWPASPRAGPRQMRQRARSKLLVTTDTDEKAMHAADTPGVSISPHTGKSAPAARGMPTAL